MGEGCSLPHILMGSRIKGRRIMNMTLQQILDELNNLPEVSKNQFVTKIKVNDNGQILCKVYDPRIQDTEWTLFVRPKVSVG